MEYLADTPSGDPMHYAYEEAGAKWNPNTRFWEMNGMLDLNTDEIRASYNAREPLGDCAYFNSSIRTNFPLNSVNDAWGYNYSLKFAFANMKNLEVLSLGNIIVNQLASTFSQSGKMRRIEGYIISEYIYPDVFKRCFSLEDLSLKNIKSNVVLKDCPLLSIQSMKYMIDNASTTPVVITLHPDAYSRAMADSTIQAALTAHPNISLASA